MTSVPDWLHMTGTTAPVTAALAVGGASLFNPAYLIPLGGLGVATLAAGAAKAGAVRLLPPAVSARPSTSGWLTAGGEATGCGLFPRLGGGGGTAARAASSGFPSGHATQMFFIAAFFAAFAIARGGDTAVVALRVGVLAAIAIAVAAQRVASRCHSVPQVVAGAVLGAVLGVVAYDIASAHACETFPRIIIFSAGC